MNGTEEPGTDDKVSVLFRFYTRKVISRIRVPGKPGMKRGTGWAGTGNAGDPPDGKTA